MMGCVDSLFQGYDSQELESMCSWLLGRETPRRGAGDEQRSRAQRRRLSPEQAGTPTAAVAAATPVHPAAGAAAAAARPQQPSGVDAWTVRRVSVGRGQAVTACPAPGAAGDQPLSWQAAAVEMPAVRSCLRAAPPSPSPVSPRAMPAKGGVDGWLAAWGSLAAQQDCAVAVAAAVAHPGVYGRYNGGRPAPAGCLPAIPPRLAQPWAATNQPAAAVAVVRQHVAYMRGSCGAAAPVQPAALYLPPLRLAYQLAQPTAGDGGGAPTLSLGSRHSTTKPSSDKELKSSCPPTRRASHQPHDHTHRTQRRAERQLPGSSASGARGGGAVSTRGASNSKAREPKRKREREQLMSPAQPPVVLRPAAALQTQPPAAMLLWPTGTIKLECCLQQPAALPPPLAALPLAFAGGLGRGAAAFVAVADEPAVDEWDMGWLNWEAELVPAELAGDEDEAELAALDAALAAALPLLL